MSNHPTGVDPIAVLGEARVQVFNVCDVIDLVLPEYWGSDEIDNEDVQEAVARWCQQHDADEYSRSREFFDIHEAARKAAEKGFTRVVVEDLS